MYNKDILTKKGTEMTATDGDSNGADPKTEQIIFDKA